MKIFIAFRYTGEDYQKLKQVLGRICRAIAGAGHNNFCSIELADHYLQNNTPVKEIMSSNFKEIKKCDALLAYVASPEKSEGMLMEVGHALALGKKFILAIKKGVDNTYLPELADEVIEFTDLQDLCDKLVNLN